MSAINELSWRDIGEINKHNNSNIEEKDIW